MGRATRRTWRRPVRGRERRAWGVTPPITFGFDPEVRLRTKALIALGADPSADPATWQWQDIAEDIRYTPGIVVAQGRPDWYGIVQRGRAALTLDNRGGKYSRRNPLSPYYGLLSRNTPIRLSVNPGDGDHIRFEGFVAEWPTRWDKTGRESTVPIVCYGVLDRLGLGDVLQSPLRKAILASGPRYYWPLEDSAGSTIGASPISGQRAMSVGGDVVFAANSDVPGSKPLPDLSGGGNLLRTFLTGVSSSTWTVEFSGTLPDGFYVPFEWEIASGTLTGGHWQFACLGGGDIRILAYNEAGTQFTPLATVGADSHVGAHNWAITAAQNGTGIDFQMYRDGVLVDTGSEASQTLGTVRTIRVNPFGVTSPAISIGHVAVYSDATQTGHGEAFAGYVGEQAHVRIGRLCEEESVPFVTMASTSAALGAQPIGSLLDIARDAEKADQGVLFEASFGLGYQSRGERYNAPVGLALDWGQLAQEPAPDDDTQRLRNRAIISRRGGSSVTVDDEANISTEGVRADQDTVNVESDNQLEDYAGWRVHIGTVDEYRWPNLELEFSRNPELIAAWTALNYGARVTVADPFFQHPDDIDVFAEGHEEQWDQFLWSASIYGTSPASAYDIGLYGPSNTVVSRYDTAGSQTTAAFLSGTDTSMTVATTLGPIWIEDVAHFPFNIRCSGVILEVTAISGGSSPQTFTITQTPVNGLIKTIPAGESVSLAEPSFYGF